MKNQLLNYINNSRDPLTNFWLAYEYDCQNQLASAVSFYLRAAENTDDIELSYESILRSTICIDKLGNRPFTKLNMLEMAASIAPRRPEAFFMLSKHHENNGNWYTSYMMSVFGRETHNNALKPLLTNVGYVGKYAILFQQAVSAWWLGRCEESRTVMYELINDYEMNEEYTGLVKYNISNIGLPEKYR